jgi:hypothetical protein
MKGQPLVVALSFEKNVFWFPMIRVEVLPLTFADYCDGGRQTASWIFMTLGWSFNSTFSAEQ